MIRRSQLGAVNREYGRARGSGDCARKVCFASPRWAVEQQSARRLEAYSQISLRVQGIYLYTRIAYQNGGIALGGGEGFQ